MVTLAAAMWPPSNGGPPSCLIVLCHGAAATGESMTRMAKVVGEQMPDVALLAPHGLHPSSVRPQTREWFAPPYAEPYIGPRTVIAAAALDEFIDAQLAAARLPPDAYVMGGFSQGAVVSLHAGLRRKVPPRAIVAFAGVLVNPLPPLTAPPPVQLIAGMLDHLVTPKLVRDTEQILRDAGVAVESHYIPGLAHEVTPVVINLGGAFIRKALGRP
jgi:phospholipase/carboxylesterase